MTATISKAENGFIVTTSDGRVFIAEREYQLSVIIEGIFTKEAEGGDNVQ